MGRLFDAIAALCGLPSRVSFEGQAAMQLEFAAAPEDGSAYSLAIRDEGPWVIDWQPLVEQVLLDRSAGESVGCIAARFHNALAAVAVELATRAGCPRVALSGGCFQNRLLTERCLARLSEAGFEVYTHRQVPPGDGGIALGQILAAALRIEG
jgi:hydrogenase maturation protein HypF